MKKDFSKYIVLLFSTLVMACSQDVKFDLPAAQDNFGQSITYNNKVDILWIVDNSSSMSQHQQRLSDQIPDMVSKLNSLKMDYQMAVITTSVNGTNNTGGKFIGTPKFVKSTTPDLVNNLKSRMLIGQDGNNNERGLDSMAMALSSSYLANEGKGFLRSEALLVVIALSDEDDKASVANPGTYFANYLDSIKTPWLDGSRSWVFNFIGVLPTSAGCTTFNDYAEVGDVFLDLVAKSGGVKETICSTSLSNAVLNIRARIVQILTDFKLEQKPLVSSIVVRINGVEVPRNSTNGWDYIESTNVIRFYGTAVPPADAAIKVDFKPAEAS